MKPRALGRILQQPVPQRREVIAEGLALLAEHVHKVRADVHRLAEAGGLRGVAILQAQLEEEAAKSLILLDLVRMGWSDQAAASRHIGYFSDHLPRCIYADIVDMRPATFEEIRRLVESMRDSHYLDGPTGVDWIFRNQLIAEREQTLYVDYVDYEDAGRWVTPASYDNAFFGVRTPAADLVISMDRLGITRPDGLAIVADAWVGRTIHDDTHWQEVLLVNRQVIEESVTQGGAASDASEDDVRRVLQWGYPMGSLDLRQRSIDRTALEKRRAEWDPYD